MPAKSSKAAAPPIRVPKRPTPPDRIPRVVADPSLDDHLAIITRAVFQAGLSWAAIDARWDRYVAAFEGFDCRAVAALGEGDVERILESGGIVRSRGKIAATLHNARALVAIEREFGSVAAYQRSFPDHPAAVADARERFRQLGDLSVYYWRFRTGAPVPPLEEWMRGQERDHPRMREMVAREAQGDRG